MRVPTENHYSVYVDRREDQPFVCVWNKAAGIHVGDYRIRKVRDLIALGRLLAHGTERGDEPYPDPHEWVQPQ